MRHLQVWGLDKWKTVESLAASRLEAGISPGKQMANRPSAARPEAGQTSDEAKPIQLHWSLYVMEAAELAMFMISACAFTVFLFHPASPVAHMLPGPWVRRACMGVAMGITAVLIIHSPFGKRSGAHFNPAITLTYLRLGKIRLADAAFYVVFQFLGSLAGVGASALLLGSALADPSVNYAVTIPGSRGPAAAFAAELFMATLLMAVVLYTSNRPALANATSYCVGILITFYILLFAPVSGFSINPARSTGSAVFAHLWTAIWIYFSAPLLGMLGSAEVYRRVHGRNSILCAKLHPDSRYPCPFLCQFPGHRQHSIENSWRPPGDTHPSTV